MTRQRVWVASLVAALSLSCAHAPVEPRAPAAAEPAPIRDFDVATIEQLARAMYSQDRLAWIATDVLFAQRTEQGATDDGVRGWITATLDGHDAVRFIRVGEHGPELLYDVTFAGDGPPIFSSPASRTLLPQERAQYDARILALDNVAQPCSDRYNTVALRDPESDGWLVWALAASLDPEAVLIGGHYRFTISPDGGTIRARDALSTTCLRFEKNEDSAGSLMSHVVSLTPVETHAFASLVYKWLLHVGTEDGSTWRVESGRITRVEADSPGLDGFAARALAAIYERCTFIVATPDRSTKQYVHTGNTKVIEATENAPTYSVADPAEGHIEWVTCLRKDIVPLPNDYKVAAAGYSLAIRDTGKGHPERSGLLTFAHGKFDFAILDGEPLTPDLARRVDARLEAFQWALMR